MLNTTALLMNDVIDGFNKKGGAVLIKRIKLKGCVPYQEAELSDCKRVNFVFGANGSGKSTISAFLAGSTDPRFEHSTIEWDGPVHEPVYVYNRDFRKNNFRQIIPGVFTMGNATIEDINALDQLKIELAQKKEDWAKKHETYQKLTQEDIPKREEAFKEEAWNRILKPNSTDFSKAFGGLRGSKDRFVAELKKRISGIPGHAGIVCERSILIDRAKRLYVERPQRCEYFEVDVEHWLEEQEIIRNNPIWNTVIAGNKDVDIAALIDELENSSWVDQGRRFLRAKSNICPFCQKETITDDFKNKLESFFDTEYKRRVSEMKNLLEEYKNAANHIISEFKTAVQNERSVNVGKLDTEIYFAKENLLTSLYSDHENKMEAKIKEPGIKISISNASLVVEEMVSLINAANKSIDAHNSLLDERNTAETQLTDDVWASVINQENSLIKTYQTEINNMTKAANGIKEACDKSAAEVNSLEAAVIEKGKSITSVQPAIDEINRSLKAYGFTNFSIQPADSHVNYYCIKRDDGSLADDTLSEGEETFLTFLYFMQWTKGSTDQEHMADKKIIVIDDPISSLDSTILYIVGDMVKELSRSIRNGRGDVNQLFVLTHNVFFHKEASFISSRTNEIREVNYWIVRKDDGVSTIIQYGTKNPVSTTYELLWQELRDNENLTRITIQNTMRRILENYFGMLGREKDDSLVKCFTESEDQMIARSLIAWINDGSHSIPDDLYIDSYTDAIPRYKDVFKRIFYKSGHKAHYNMMMKIEDELVEH